MHRVKIHLLLMITVLLPIITGCDSFIRNNLEEEQVTEQVIIIDDTNPGHGISGSNGGLIINDYDINKIASVTSNYAFECIDTNEKEVYTEIYRMLIGFKTDVELPTLDTDLMDHAFSCVLIDHPEIFYVKGYSLKTYTRGNIIEKITMSGNYTMEPAQAKSYAMAIEAYVQKCETNIPNPDDEYEAVKGVYEYIINNTEYDLEAENNQNILSVFLDHRSVCQGYAKATQYILNDMGIFCTLVEGHGKNNESHVWNLVRINGNYYYVDTTWGDASYSLISSDDYIQSTMPVPDINYDYLCITTKDLLVNHEIVEIVPVPLCTSMDDNYYVRSGYYFTYVDDSQLRAAFDKGYADNLITLTIKCANANIYHDMREYLLSEEKIFNYLKENTASYVEIEEQNEIMVYL